MKGFVAEVIGPEREQRIVLYEMSPFLDLNLDS